MLQPLLAHQEALSSHRKMAVYVLCPLWRQGNTLLLLLASKGFFPQEKKNSMAGTAALMALKLLPVGHGISAPLSTG